MSDDIFDSFGILRNLRFLIVDDEPMMRQKLSNYLSCEYDSNIITATDGQQAIDNYKLHQNEIAITFLDIDMPKINGMVALTEIRMINPEAYIIMVSGNGTLGNVKEALAYGVNGFIVKPYTNEKIDEVMRGYTATALRLSRKAKSGEKLRGN